MKRDKPLLILPKLTKKALPYGRGFKSRVMTLNQLSVLKKGLFAFSQQQGTQPQQNQCRRFRREQTVRRCAQPKRKLRRYILLCEPCQT